MTARSFTHTAFVLAAVALTTGAIAACSSEQPNDEDREVARQVQGAVSCDSTYRNKTVNGGSMSSYGCYPSLSLPGPEWVQSLTVASTGDVVVAASKFSAYPFLVVLRDLGTGVDPSNCVAANYYSVRFPATAGEKFYVVVDTDSAVSSMTFDAHIECAAGTAEAACNDGFDNDGDFLIDCADADCSGDSICSGGSCSPFGRLACGDMLVPGSTDGFGTTDRVDAYTCPSDRASDSPEHAYTFEPTTTGWATFTLSNFGQYPMLFVIEDDGSGCNPNRCVAHNYYSVNFYATAGKKYYLVADGWGGAPYSYYASLVCEPPAEETDCANSVDDDGDGAIDCMDPGCAADPACVSGMCEAVATVDCATTLLHGSTSGAGATNVVSSYTCAPSVDLNGPEMAYRFGPVAKAGRVLVTASNFTTYPMISVLQDKGAGCDPGSCVAEQYYGTSFTTKKGASYYIVVEGDMAPSIDYDLSVICGPPTTEVGLCDDQIDNDGDMLIDCADPDCASACASACQAADALTSTATLKPGSTADVGATNAIDAYSCFPANSMPGNEYVYEYVATQTGPTLFALSDLTDYAAIAVLEDRGAGCDPNHCVAFQYYSAVANLTAGSTYFIVVDGMNAGTLSYSLSVIENPPFNESALCVDNIDNDGDTLIDCADPDCTCGQ